MVLSIALVVLVCLTVAVLVRPLLAPPAGLQGGDDREVYAAQLAELEADKARGLINAADADAARTEIARRLLRARDGGEGTGQAPPRRRAWPTAVLVALFVPVLSAGLYFSVGQPRYADQPLALRALPPTEADIGALLAAAEERLAANPDDGDEWIAVAPVYLRMGRFDDAAQAYARANELLGERAEWVAAQGESLAFANQGVVSPEARVLLERANNLDPNLLRPAIFLAIADRQQGDFAAAQARWQSLLAGTTGDEPWLQIARAELDRMGASGEGAPAGNLLAAPSAPPSVGPTVQSAARAAAGATSGARASGPANGAAGEASPPPAMIADMVSRLAERLASDGGSVEEWVRLVRSYTVLGREDDAREAVVAALAALPSDDHEAFSSAPEVARLLP